MSDSAQRATLVLERNFEDDEWSVVAYLIRDSGQRSRHTLTRRDSRDEATEALEALWNKLLKKAD